MKKVFLAIATIIILHSCKEKDQLDVLAPVLTHLVVNGDQSAQHILTAPLTLTLDFTCTDNTELNQLKVDIVPVDFQNVSSTYGLNTGDWSYSEILNLDGISATRTLSISFPDSTAGNWEIKAQLTDVEGNISMADVVRLNMQNPNLPEIIAVTTPSLLDGAVTMNSGTNLIVSANVQDADSLNFVEARIETLNGIVLGSPINVPVSSTGIAFEATFNNMSTGHYMMVVEGKDKFGYRRLLGIHVNVE